MDKKQQNNDSGIAQSIMINQKSAVNADTVNIAKAQLIVDQVQWQYEEETVETIETDEDHEIQQKPARKKRFWLFAFLLVFALGVTELTLFTIELMQSQDWLAGLWLLVIGGGVVLSIRWLIKEWFGLRRLKQQEQDKQTAYRIFSGPAIGEGKDFCLKLAKGLAPHRQKEVILWQTELQGHHNDKEALSLFEKQVLVAADKEAMKHVSANASACAAMIAVSPFALLDMAIVLWRNFKMLNNVSQSYGVKLGYWGRVALVRSVFKTMLYAGASEILADAGNYAMGAGITGKLSTRLGQGVGAGVLTARIGVKAMQACRPIPWLATQKPGLGQITTQLVSDLKKSIV
jgi:putative membrane protein